MCSAVASRPVAGGQAVEEVQALSGARRCTWVSVAIGIAGAGFAEVADMGLDGEVAAAGRDVVGVDADQPQEGVGGVGEAPAGSGPRSCGRCSRSSRAGRCGRSCGSAARGRAPGWRRRRRTAAARIRRGAGRRPSRWPSAPAGWRRGCRRGCAPARGSGCGPTARRTGRRSGRRGRRRTAGTSVRCDQGQVRQGPNWAMKWRMPASPPATR